MKLKDRAGFYDTIRGVLKNRTDFDLNNPDELDVIVTELAMKLEFEYAIKKRIV